MRDTRDDCEQRARAIEGSERRANLSCRQRALPRDASTRRGAARRGAERIGAACMISQITRGGLVPSRSTNGRTDGQTERERESRGTRRA